VVWGLSLLAEQVVIGVSVIVITHGVGDWMRATLS
jgi:hypothetical protein